MSHGADTDADVDVPSAAGKKSHEEPAEAC